MLRLITSLQTGTGHQIEPDMSNVIEELSCRAPTIVISSLCVAIIAYWVETPVWLPYGLAIGLGCMALVLMSRRQRRPANKADEGDAGWLAQELAGNGSPSGTYPLGFCAVVTIALTGFQGAYALPAWAALALIAAWAVANARYPTGDEPEGLPPLSD